MLESAFIKFFIISLVPVGEAVDISCGSAFQREEVHCTCNNSNGQGIEWWVDSNVLTTCLDSVSSCIPSKFGYTFSVNTSAHLYYLTINSHSYSRCGFYECRDLADPSNLDAIEISISNTYLDMSWEPDEKTEPGNHTSGYFNVTTPCLFNVTTIETKWYKVMNDSTTIHEAKEKSTKVITTYCQMCKGVYAAKIQSSFLHTEAKPNEESIIEVKFILGIFDSKNMSNAKNISFPGLYNILIPSVPRPAIRCWIIILIFIAFTRLQYAQTWFSGYRLYRRRKEIKDFNSLQCVEIMMILLTALPCVGIISCIWEYFKSEKEHKHPKWFKWTLAIGFTVGCIQPGFGLFITGAAYATYMQKGWAFVFASVILILLVGADVAFIITCTVLKIDWYYYILISAGHIVVWIIAAVIMVKYVHKIYTMEKNATIEFNERQDVSENEDLKDVDCTCDVCGEHVIHTLKGFCLEENIFLCNSCLSKHKCKGKHLKHNQHDGGRENCFPCERKSKEGHRNVPAHGYCLECMLYLCTECLIDHNEHELLWMPHHNAKTFDDICCFKTRTDRNNTIPLGFCKTCKMYICEECTSRHNGAHNKEPHIIIFHQHKDTQAIPQKCSECPNPMECHKLNANKYLCADCYESDYLWTKNTCDDYSKTIQKASKKCQLHNEVGDSPAQYSPTDVFCIVCELYLCKDCFKVHRRFRERWIATHKENLFTCKGCQEKNNVFPVECFCIKSKSFLCSVCFEDNKTTSKQTTKKYLRPETISRLSDKPDCELHKVPFQCEERKHSSTVYCLICKTYMCDDCFKKHLRLKQVWNNRKKEVQSVIQSSFKHNEVSPEPM